MTTNTTTQPKEYDAVLGGQSIIPFNAAVLGGIAGVKSRLASSIIEAKIAALSEALKYGEAGLDLLAQTQALQSESMIVRFAAYNALRKHHEGAVFHSVSINLYPKMYRGCTIIAPKWQYPHYDKPCWAMRDLPPNYWAWFDIQPNIVEPRACNSPKFSSIEETYEGMASYFKIDSLISKGLDGFQAVYKD